MDGTMIVNQRKATNNAGFSQQAQHHPKILHKSAEPSLSINPMATQLPSVKLSSVKPSQKQFIGKTGPPGVSSYLQESDQLILRQADDTRKTNVSYIGSALHSYNQPSQRDSQKGLGLGSGGPHESRPVGSGRLDDYFQSMQSHQQMLQSQQHHAGGHQNQQYRSTMGQGGLQHIAQTNQQRVQNIYRSTSQNIKGTKGRTTGTTVTSSNTGAGADSFGSNSYQQSSFAMNQKGTGGVFLSNVKTQQQQSYQTRESMHTQGNPESAQLGDDDDDQRRHRTPFKSVTKNRPNRNRTTENHASRGIAAHQLHLQQSSQMPSLTSGGHQYPGHSQLYASPEVLGMRAHSQQRPGQQTRLQPINLTNKISAFANSSASVTVATSQLHHHQHAQMNPKPAITSGSYVINSDDNAHPSVLKSYQSKHSSNGQPADQQKRGGKAAGATNKSTQNKQTAAQSTPIVDASKNLKTSQQQQKIPLHKKDATQRSIDNQKDGSEVVVNTCESKDELLVTFFDKSFALLDNTGNQMTEADLDEKGESYQAQQPNSREQTNTDKFNLQKQNQDFNFNQPRNQQQLVPLHQLNSDESKERRAAPFNFAKEHPSSNRLALQFQHHTPNHDKSDNLRYGGAPNDEIQNGQRTLILQQQVQHKSQKNLQSVGVNSQHQRGSSSISLELNDRQIIQDSQANSNLNNSMNLKPSGGGHHQPSVELKNLHPQGLYIGGTKQRKQNKTAQQNSTVTHKAEAEELLPVNRQSKLNHSQGSDLGQQDQNSSSVLLQADGNESLQALNQSMLVQECDLSQGTGLQDINGVVNGAADSERMSSHSISNAGASKFHYFKDELNHRVQASNHSVDTSPMTKTYNLKNKINYKSKVNMKSFLLNNSTAQKGRKQIGPINQASNDQKIENDRASQRSIVESTNAYIRATHMNLNDATNRIQYLQSAGTIGGNSNSIPGQIGSRHRVGSLAMNNNMTAATGHLIQHQSQQHLMPTAGTPEMRMQAAAQSRGKLRPLDQKMFNNLKPVGQLLSEQAPLGVGQASDLDPDMTLFQLRQEIHRVPHDQAPQSRQSSQLVGVHPTSFQLAERHQKLTQGDPGNNSYQTINMHQQRGDTNSQFLVGSRDLPNYMLSAEKTRFELQSQQNIYHPRLDASLSNSSQHVQSSNMSTLIGGNQSNMGTGNNKTAQNGGNNKFSIKQMHNKTNGSELNNRLDQNPFQKGPKLHLFKKSRRLKTSSAARQAHEDVGPNGHDGSPMLPDDGQHQTITSGIGPTIQQRIQIQQKKQNGHGLETNTTTINTVSQQSYSNVYGTIEHKAKAGAHQVFQTPDIVLHKQHTMGPEHAAQKAASPLRMIGLINQNSDEKQSSVRVGSGSINPSASPYQDQMQKSKQKAETKLRPHTSEMFQTSSTFNDMYGEAEDDREPLGKDNASLLRGLESQLSRRQTNQTKASRSRHHLAESRTSNTSSLNHDHNRTAQFNILPESSNINGAMYGSKHSFYGTQQTSGMQAQKDLQDKSRSGKSSVLLSKSSSKHNNTNKQPKIQQHSTQASASSSSHVKLPPKAASSNNRNNGADMNHTFSNARAEQTIQPFQQTVKDFAQNARENEVAQRSAGLDGHHPKQSVQKSGGTSFNNKLASPSSGSHENHHSRGAVAGKRQKSKQQLHTQQNCQSPRSIYQSKVLQKQLTQQMHQSEERESHDRMTRNDSAQTPYFIPTPQRTDSNWGGDAYQSGQQTSSNQVFNSKELSKKSSALHEAIQNVRSSESIKSQIQGTAANFPTKQLKKAGARHQTGIQNKAELNIKIANNKQSDRGQQKSSSLAGYQVSKPHSKTQVSTTTTPAQALTQEQDIQQQMKDAEMSQRMLQQALQHQASFDAQRRNLQSQNKAYRQSTRQTAAGSRAYYIQQSNDAGHSSNDQNHFPMSSSVSPLPRTIL